MGHEVGATADGLVRVEILTAAADRIRVTMIPDEAEALGRALIAKAAAAQSLRAPLHFLAAGAQAGQG